MDWIDILLHTGIALGGVYLLYRLFEDELMPLFLMLNTVFWPVREAIQHYPDVLEILTSPQSLLEWASPVVSVLLLVLFLAGHPDDDEDQEYRGL